MLFEALQALRGSHIATFGDHATAGGGFASLIEPEDRARIHPMPTGGILAFLAQLGALPPVIPLADIPRVDLDEQGKCTLGSLCTPAEFPTPSSRRGRPSSLSLRSMIFSSTPISHPLRVALSSSARTCPIHRLASGRLPPPWDRVSSAAVKLQKPHMNRRHLIDDLL